MRQFIAAIWARFATEAARKANEADLDRIMARWGASQCSAEAVASLRDAGLAAAPVANLTRLYACPDHHLASGFVSALDHPKLADVVAWGAVEDRRQPSNPCRVTLHWSAQLGGPRRGVRDRDRITNIRTSL